MEVVLGVSITPTAVRMVLVEGEQADGNIVDHDTVAVPPGTDATTLAEQVVSAIVGTRESAVEAAHRLVSVGVAWSDHSVAARLRDILLTHRIDDVALVSELHAAGALAQAVGHRTGCARTALVFLEGPLATLAVVRTSDGAVVSVLNRNLLGADTAAELAGMIARLEAAIEPPQAVFMVGTGPDVAALRNEITSCTALPIYAPEDADAALPRGAALAAARMPRFEAPTVGLESGEDALTSAESTQMAAAGYTAPSAYSAVPDIAEVTGYADIQDDGLDARDEPKPFLLVGSALASIFVVGVIALVISLAVTVRPTVEQRPGPGPSATTNSDSDVAAQPSLPETIQAPVPVVQQAPRSVVVAPAAPAIRPAPPAAPLPAAPLLPPFVQPLMPAAPVTPAAPAPALPFPVLPPIVITPMWPPLLPPAPVVPRQVPPPSSNPAPTSSPQTSNPPPPVTTTVTTPETTTVTTPVTTTSEVTPAASTTAASTTAAPAPVAASTSAPSTPPADANGSATTTTAPSPLLPTTTSLTVPGA